MNDPALLARLTLLLLRSSVPFDSLPADYGVILVPSTTVLSQEEAIAALASRAPGIIAVRAEAHDSDLVISVDPPTPGELDDLKETVALFESGLHRNSRMDAEAVVRVVSATHADLIVSVKTFENWLATVVCPACPLLALGRPDPTDSAHVVGVVRIGRKRPGTSKHQ